MSHPITYSVYLVSSGQAARAAHRGHDPVLAHARGARVPPDDAVPTAVCEVVALVLESSGVQAEQSLCTVLLFNEAISLENTIELQRYQV